MMLMKKHGVGIQEILVELIIYLFFSVLDVAFGSAINVQKKKKKKMSETNIPHTDRTS